MILPQGQEAELAGFFVYCTQILGWLPPLIFSLMIEADVDYKYGVIATSFGFVISIGFLSCAASWPEIVKEAQDGGSSGAGVVGEQGTDIHYSEFDQIEKQKGVVNERGATGTTTMDSSAITDVP